MTAEEKIKWIFLASFIDLFSVSLILLSLSAHLKSIGASFFIIGVIQSIYSFMQLISGPIIGSRSDKIGRQKIFIISYIIVGSCYPLLGSLTSLFAILFLRAVIGTFKHGQVLIRTIVSDQFSYEKQVWLSGRLESVAAISFTLGPIIGGHLVEFEGGFQYICCFSGALLTINSIIGYWYFADIPIDQEDKKNDEKPESIVQGITEGVKSLCEVDWLIYGKIFTLKFIQDLGVGAYRSNYNIKIQERFGLSQKLSGYTIAFQSFVAMITGLCISNINNKFYKTDETFRTRSLHGFVLMLAGYLGVSFASDLRIFLLATIVLTSSIMMMRIVLTDMLMRKCPRSQTGSVAGTSYSVSNLARLVTPLIVGLVEDTWGANSSNLLAAAVASLGIFVSLTIEKPHSKSS